MKAHTIDEARAAKAEASNVFGSLASVAGVGIGEGYGLKINLVEKAKVPLPTEIGGIPVQIEVVGPIQKR